MVRVKLVGFPELKKELGTAEFDVPLGGEGNLSTLFQGLRDQGIPLERGILGPDGTVHTTVQVIRNGDEWIGRDDLGHPLRDGDEITVLLMMAGG